MKEPFMGMPSACLLAQIHIPFLAMDAKALRAVPSHRRARRGKIRKLNASIRRIYPFLK